MEKTTKAQRAAAISGRSVTKKYETIKLGIDWHAKYLMVVRLIDGAGPEAGQRFTHSEFYKWVKKQISLGDRVFAVSEAGAGGFVMHRKLIELGVTPYTVAPRKLDPNNRGVITDRTDALELANDLDRYVRGNQKALRVVYVPTPEQEQKRHQSRQRRQMSKHLGSLAAEGCSLLLSQGWIETKSWWKKNHWENLRQELPQWMIDSLERNRELIVAINIQLNDLASKIKEAAATVPIPKGMGTLTFEEVNREVCHWDRFKNRKQPGSYVGLVGGVSSSGNYHVDLSITKAGHIRLRAMLIQLAWRMVHYQSQSVLIQKWRKCLLNPKATKQARKKAIIAVARQMFVDLWRWQTGRKSPEQLGWEMVSHLKITAH